MLRSADFLTLHLGDTFQSPCVVPSRQAKTPRKNERRQANSSSSDHTAPEMFSQRRAASLTMGGGSNQQNADRIVGTVVVIGLSVVFVRWLSSHDSMLDEENKSKKSRKRYGILQWWPMIALRRYSGRNRNDGKCVGDDGRNMIEGEHTKAEGQEDIVENNGGEYEHHGSCHCSSITFVLRGPHRLRAVHSPGKIRYPHIPTPANKFHLLRGESSMRFYYEENNNDDSSSITFDNAVEERNDAKDASGAHVFCGNCGVHVFHADRSTGELEVNANCLDDGETTLIFTKESSSSPGPSSITLKQLEKQISASQHPPSRSGAPLDDNALDVEKLARHSTIETVSETEPFLGSAYFLESLDDRKSSLSRKESVSSDPTQPESHSTAMMAEGDDSSMGSSSVTGASMPLRISSLSLSSGGGAHINDRMDRTGLPPLPPSRISPSDRSVKTLPPRAGERHGYAPGAVGGRSVDGWSVASMESNDLDAGNLGKTIISPRTRDQMKKYMQKYT